MGPRFLPNEREALCNVPRGRLPVENVVIVPGGAQILTFPTVGVGFVSCVPARGGITTFPPRMPAHRGAPRRGPTAVVSLDARRPTLPE